MSLSAGQLDDLKPYGYPEGSADWLVVKANATVAEAGRRRHRAVLEVLQFFAWHHLPGHLRDRSAAVGHLALAMVEQLEDGPELTAGLRKLLEAKDCFVRAALPVPVELVQADAKRP